MTIFTKFKAIIAATLIGSGLIASGIAYAYRVTPLLLELSDSGRDRAGQIRIENTTDRPLTFEAYALDWSIAETGERTMSDSNAPLLIFPPQAVVPPGETQVLRVEWAGGPVTESQNFIVLVEQLAVDFAPGAAEGSGVQFLFNFGAAVHVSPQGSSANLSLAAERDGQMLQVRAENSGNRHAYLGDRGMMISAGGESYEYDADTLATAMGNTLVAAGSARVFEIALPENFPAGPVTIGLPQRS